MTMTVTTKKPALTIAACAVVMTAAATALALLGLHIQILCLQFVYVILNHLLTRFELARKIWLRICEPQNKFEGNLDDSFNSYTSKVLMSVSQD